MKKNIKNTLLAIIIGILLSGTVVYGLVLANKISYDNTDSTLTSTNVQEAIDELAEKVEEKTSSEEYCPTKYKCYKTHTTLQVGDYVKMTPTSTSYTTDTSKTGYSSTETIDPSELNLWRVIRVNEDGTIEMVSEYVSSVAVTFYGQTGYQNLVGYLNTLASQYENSKYTIGSRYMGYNGQTEYITDTTALTSTTAPWTCDTGENCNPTESQGGGDTLYENDTILVTNAIGTLQANKVGTISTEWYWLASRLYDYYFSTCWYFFGRIVNPGGSVIYGNLYDYSSGFSDFNNKLALRPIVILKSGITYAPAVGISTDPFILD